MSANKPSKKSIVGSMGLPRYEKNEDPEWMQERENRIRGLSLSSGTSARSAANSTGPSFARSPVSHPRTFDEDGKDDGYDDEGTNEVAPPVVKKTYKRASKPVETVDEPIPKAGMLGKLKGITKKKEQLPPKAVDTRRRKYNETFGKKTGTSEGFFGDENNDQGDEKLSPQEDRVRTTNAFKSGKLAAVGLGSSVPLEEDETLGSNAVTAEDVKSAAKARDMQSTTSGEVEKQDSYSDPEAADVHDDEAVPAVVMAPALIGGYLDEKVPSYDLTDPSTKKTGNYMVEKSGKSNGYAEKGAAAVGVGAAGVGAGYVATHYDENYDENEDTFLNTTQGDTEEEQYATSVEQEKKTRPPKSPKRDTYKQNGGQNGASGLIAEEEQQQHVQSPKKRAAPVSLPKRAKVAALTPIQRHYLLKALVSIQMQHEFSELEKLGALTLYGFPFSLERPKLKRVKDKQLEGDFGQGDFEEEADDPYAEADEDEIRKKEGLSEPLIARHMFHAHLHSFPGLDTAPMKYWQKRIQPFFDEMAARNFSHSIERGETTSRRFYTLAMTRYLGGFFSRGFGVRGEGELRGPGKGAPGTDSWGKGKEWGKGTVKRGLDQPVRPDAEMMDKIDALFDGREGEVWKKARKETTRIKRDWQGFKEFCIEKESGLEETMNYLDVGNLRNLPPQYRNAEEYARYHAAYIFHTLFVTSPSADSFYNVLKGIHLLFPYWGAKQMLKIANAQTMIQAILNLLLARPAGAKSLVQRIFVSVVGGQGTAIDKEYVKPLRKALNDVELCGKIEEYVKRGNRAEGRAIRNRALRTGQDVVATILLYSSGTELSTSKKNEVLDLHDSFAQSPFRGQLNSAYPDTTPIGKEGKEPKIKNWGVTPVEEGMAHKYAMLKLFLREVLKRRDREESCKMAGGSLVPTIIKESLDTVFYGAIRSIAEVSDLSSRLGDLQAFFDDIIKTKKAGENSLPAWVAVMARHENSLYFIFHECSAIMQPFTEWLQKGADYMALGTTDPAHPANRKAKNVEINLEEMLRDGQLTDEDVNEIVGEVDQLANYVKWQKIWYELELRKNILLARSDAIPASGLSEDNIPSGSNMKARMIDVDGLLCELMEQEGEEIEQGIVENDARGTEMKDYPWAWFDQLDPLHQHLSDTNPKDLQFNPSIASVKMPTLKATRKALDPFRQNLLEKLPAWKEGDAKGVPATPQAILKQRNADTQSIAPSVATNRNTPAVKEVKEDASKKSGGKSRGSTLFRIPFTGR